MMGGLRIKLFSVIRSIIPRYPLNLSRLFCPNHFSLPPSWTSLGGGIKADTSPAVARNNDGRLQVFVVGTNNQLYYKTQTSSGSATWSSSWTSLGGTLRENTDPGVVPNSDGRLVAFVMGPTTASPKSYIHS